uniref:Uncharacterized protein n=1 Tax=Timema monikensis TaxID=170555 RepID=A0A7R9EMI8_9NEOP|nr:unnamed protein product [Timema monikensis]
MLVSWCSLQPYKEAMMPPCCVCTTWKELLFTPSSGTEGGGSSTGSPPVRNLPPRSSPFPGYM